MRSGKIINLPGSKSNMPRELAHSSPEEMQAVKKESSSITNT